MQMKNKAKHLLVMAAAATMVGFLTQNAAAQDRGNAEQMRQDRLERYRARIEVKAEDDWKKLEPLVGKVMDAQRDAFAYATIGGGGGFGGGGRRGGGGGGGGGNASAGTDGNNNRNRFGGTPPAEVEALRKAIEAKAPAEEIKEKLTKLREARKAKEDALEKAQDELRKALSPRQEAGAVMAGLLK
jgi:hypothetical protein